MNKTHFDWDVEKDAINQEKHNISFSYAQKAFFDPKRVIYEDLKHSRSEKRYFCFGKVEGDVLTVRFTYRGSTIRIIGAGYWRKGRQYYEEESNLHK